MKNNLNEYTYIQLDIYLNPIASNIKAKNPHDRTDEDKNYLKSIDKENIMRKFFLNQDKKNQINPLNSSKTVTEFPRTGTNRLLVILIDFTDLSFSIANGNFDNLMNQNNYNETGSFRDYWLSNSYNTLTVNSTVSGWYHASHNMAYYGANSNGNDINPRLLVQEAIDAAENAGVDFSLYDNDNDDIVDDLIIIHAGYGEEAGANENTIWSHHWTLGDYQRTYDGVTINKYAIVPELRNFFGNNINNIGVICHEFGHSLGLPDLYDTDLSSEGIGRWGLMGSGNWNNNGVSPSNLCAWSKVFLGWSNPTVISNPNNFSISNNAQNNQIYKITTPHSNEYFLLENRQLTNFDIGLPGTGLAIWHINTSKITSQNLSDNNVNSDESLKGVDLEEADGLDNLDNHDNRGDDGDLFPGSSHNSTFNDSSNPNSQTYPPIVNVSKGIIHLIEQNNLINVSFMPNYYITGSNLICSSGDSVTVHNVPSWCTINWSTGSFLSLGSQQGTNPGNFYSIGSGSSWISATINSTWGSSSLPNYEVWSGVPSGPTVYPSSLIYQPINSTFSINISDSPGADASTGYWDIYGCLSLNGSNTGSSASFYSCSFDGCGTVYVSTSNVCGSLYRTAVTVISGTGGDCGILPESIEKPTLLISPNPAYDFIDISISTVKANDNEKYKVEIVDLYSKIVKQFFIYSPNERIPISDLPNGSYLVFIKCDHVRLQGKFIVLR